MIVEMKVPHRPVPHVVTMALILALLIFVTILVRRATQYEFLAFQDEGLLLTYPDLILRGYRPYVDFATMYTPGGFYLLAALYSVFGESITVERWAGVAYWCLIVSAVFLIGLRVSMVTALLSALIALAYASLFDAPVALPHFAAYAAMLFGILFLSLSAGEPNRTTISRAFIAGLLAGVSVWFKQDIGAIAFLALLAGASTLDFQRLRALLMGFAIPALGLLAFFVAMGLATSFDSVILDAIRTAPGVVLPITFNLSVVVVTICVCGNIVAAVIATRAGAPASLLCLTRSIVALSFGLSVAALHRFGPQDISYLGVPIVSLTLVSLHIATLTVARAASTRALITYAIAGLLPVVIGHVSWFGTYGIRALPLASNDRVIPWPQLRADSTPPQAIISKLNAISKEGEKLFVGPSDLRFALQNDSSALYFLLPKLRPASRYIEMSPGRANRPDSGLADDVAAADWIILTSQFAGHTEPNASRIPGSPKPNEVVRLHFCVRDQHEAWQLLQRCSQVRR